MSEQVTIYALVDPRDESTRYVGQTRQPLEQRLAQHCAERVMGPKGTWIAELEALGLRPVPWAEMERALHRVALRLGLAWDELRERAGQLATAAASPPERAP